MVYGDEKLLEMARSILPSTRRRQARVEKAKVKRAARHKVRVELIRSLENEDSEADLNYYPYEKISMVVGDRRSADKVAPFINWAKEKTKHLPADDRLAKVRKVLPNSIIGWHAVGHLKFDAHFRGANHPRDWRSPRPPKEAVPKLDFAVVLEEIVRAPGAHHLLNQYMLFRHTTTSWNDEITEWCGVKNKWEVKKSPTKLVGPVRPRLLKGLGDIKSFLTDLDKARKCKAVVKGKERTSRRISPVRYWYPSDYTGPKRTYIYETKSNDWPNPLYHPEWWRAMEGFVSHWMKAQGDLQKVSASIKLKEVWGQ